MFYRKITKQIEAWYQDQTAAKKGLVIEGLRQVGKTTTILDFLHSHYAHVNYINFKDSPSFKDVFKKADFDQGIDRFLTELSVMMPGSDFFSEGSVLFLDEVQECSRARYSIKPLCAKTKLHIIASGSLLGIRGYNRETDGDVPTGSETILTMFPMDFEEFLLAMGEPQMTLDYLRDCFQSRSSIAGPIHERMLGLFRQYLVVGGMPEVVDIFLKTHSLSEVVSKQRSLILEYRGDFGRYVDKNGVVKIDEILRQKLNLLLDSVPSQLAKENAKFIYREIQGKPRKSAYADALDWLCEFGLLSKCHRLNALSLPLASYADLDAYKIYMQDTGLFLCMLDDGTATHILHDELGSFKGYVYENIVADALIKQKQPLYYYSNDNGLEIDFVLPIHGRPALVEVKAKSGHAKASRTVLADKKKYPEVEECIKLTANNIGVAAPYSTFPYYLAHLLSGEKGCLDRKKHPIDAFLNLAGVFVDSEQDPEQILAERDSKR